MRSRATMRPNSFWTALQSSILAMVFLTLKADSDDCSTELMVRRNTNYTAFVGEELWINCPVKFCKKPPPPVVWFKDEDSFVRVDVSNNTHIKTEWKRTKELEGISYLVFKNILRSDSGSYHCESRSKTGEMSSSHTIFIKINNRLENDTRKETNKEKTNSTNSKETGTHTHTLLMYVYCAAGIGSFVIIVIVISVISMRGCQGKSKKETQKENQYIEIPVAERPMQQASHLQPSPRGSPSSLPSRRSSERKTPRQPNDLESPGNPEHLYEQRKQNRNTAPSEDSSSVVYAALNHGLPPRTTGGRPPQREVENTEYAAIRLA